MMMTTMMMMMTKYVVSASDVVSEKVGLAEAELSHRDRAALAKIVKLEVEGDIL